MPERLEWLPSVPDGTVGSVVDAFAQVLARLEVRHVLAGERHRFTRLWIAALPRRTEVQRERAEATYLDAISRRQGIAHDLEDLFERELHILGWQVFLFRRDDLDELGLCHGPLPFFLLLFSVCLTVTGRRQFAP